MKFGKWLNSLDGIDHMAIVFFFGISIIAAHYIIKNINSLYLHLQRDNKYAPDFRGTPTVYFLIALPITIILYLLAGSFVTGLLR